MTSPWGGDLVASPWGVNLLQREAGGLCADTSWSSLGQGHIEEALAFQAQMRLGQVTGPRGA